MRRRMVLPDRATPRVIDLEHERNSRFERALLDRTDLHEQIAGLLLRFSDPKAYALAAQHAGIASLPAGLAIERRLVDHHRAALAGFQLRDLFTVAHQR